MLKDRAQKATALKLCVSKRWLPQIEIDVEATTRLEQSRFLLTDIDVLAVAPSTIGPHTKLIFDCKSGARESAIGRAFWLHGVMTKTSASHGFVVLSEKVKITHDHRTSASDLGVSLLHEKEIGDLAQCLGGSTSSIDAATSDINVWEQFLAIGPKYIGLTSYCRFSRSGFWMIKDGGEQCRKTVARLRAIGPELDPEKPEHLAVFGDALCLFLLALSDIANRLFLVLLRPASQEEFSTSILALLYGGYDNLEAAQKIRHLTAGDAAAESSLSIFPELKRFEQLVREVLQAPQEVLAASLLARETGFCTLAELKSSSLQKQIVKESPFSAKYVLIAGEYLQKAARLPQEFSVHFSDISMKLSADALSPRH
ncbi:hypothetical protein [Marinimicrobium locisalis]|uniref:hypothetical protein n=1 Tax=Marinimicrobium locisalis TaxID=546022 RepID=UPI003221FDB8